MRNEWDPFSQMDARPALSADHPSEVLRFAKSDWGKEYLAALNGKPYYLTDWQGKIYLPDFPSNTSKRTRAELDDLLRLQEKRTSTHLDSIQKELEFKWYTLDWGFTPKPSPETMPMTDLLMRRAVWDTSVVVCVLKDRFARPRPVHLEPKLKPCISHPPYPAYPSGHTTVAQMVAYILKQFKPDGEKRFFKEAFRVGWDREVAGIHFASDTAAGGLLAPQIMDLLLKTPSFREDLEKARVEWTQIKLVKDEPK